MNEFSENCGALVSKTGWRDRAEQEKDMKQINEMRKSLRVIVLALHFEGSQFLSRLEN